MRKPLRTIHPENRSELAEADLEAFQKDLVRYINDLSDEHITVAVNHFASQQSALGSKNTKMKNPLQKWIESTKSWKYHIEYEKLGKEIRKQNKERYEEAMKLRKEWGIE